MTDPQPDPPTPDEPRDCHDCMFTPIQPGCIHCGKLPSVRPDEPADDDLCHDVGHEFCSCDKPPTPDEPTHYLPTCMDCGAIKQHIGSCPNFVDQPTPDESINAYRDMLEWIALRLWNQNYPDGFDFQDEMVRRGFFVEAPSTPEERDDWDQDTMFVLAWGPRAPKETI